MSRSLAKFLVAPLFPLMLSGCATMADTYAPAEPVETAAAAYAPDFSVERLNNDMRALADDSLQGRGTATPGEAMAIQYIVAQMRAAGLEPAGDTVNGLRQWTQAVPLQRSTLVGEPKLTLHHGGKASSLTLDKDMTVRAPLNGSDTIRIEDAEMVFLGYGAYAPEREWDDYKDVDLKGKIAVMLVNDPDFEGPISDGGPDFGGKAMTYYGRWTYKFEEAARRGAAGVLVVHEDAPASYGFNVVADSRSSVFDIVADGLSRERSSLEGWMSNEMAARVLEASGTSYQAAKAMARKRDFKPFTLKPTLSVSADAKVEKVTTRNIAGMIKGAKRPDETVIYSGHYDHLGVGEPNENGDAIYNGALDNASGIASILELGRAFANGPQPDRTVLILAVGAEEMGLLGSRYYAAAPLFPIGKTVAALNMDMFMPFGLARDFAISGSAKLGLLDMMVEEGAKQGRTLSPDNKPEAGYFYRSDHFSFAKAGVPAVSINSGFDLVDGGLEKGKKLSEEFTAKYYHTQEDEFNPDYDWAGLIQDMELMYGVGERLAFGNLWPNWDASSEFKAIRDETAAARQ